MTDSEKQETKEKILQTARELFAKFGYSGTSVRDISQGSGANVASINYYFGSKHNLYWAVVQASHDLVKQGFQEISSRVDNVEDMVVEVFDFLLNDRDSIRTSLKLMLTDGVPDPEGEQKEVMEATMGPPGMEHMVHVLRKQGLQASDEQVFFAVNCIFGHLIHWSMLCSCSKIEVMQKQRPELRPEAIKESLKMHARALCEFISK